MDLQRIAAPLLACAFALIGCGARSLPPPLVFDVTSPLSHNTNPSVNPSDLATLVENNNDFAFALYQKLRTQPGNFCFSPISISSAFAMLYGGARHNTQRQMSSALRFSLPQSRLHPAMNRLLLDLNSRSDVTLVLANSVWCQTGWQFLRPYLDLLAVNYGAGIGLLDFKGDQQGSCQTINDWISQRTNGRITDGCPSDLIDALTILVLTNTVFFKADWEYPFSDAGTDDSPFLLLDNTYIIVPTMYQEVPDKLGITSDYVVGELPYKGGNTSMLFLDVIDSGAFTSFEASLDASTLAEALASLHPDTNDVYLPKFSFSSSFRLKSALQALGMLDAFKAMAADFSGIDGFHDLYVNDAAHKTLISVTEKGTEGSASTVVPPQLLGSALCLDHPFIFIVRDIPTGQILFIGRVVNPLQ